MARIGVSIAVTEESTEQRPQFEDLPNGTYLLEMSASTAKEEISPRKFSLNTTVDVVEPEHLKGRKLFVNYNLEHPNAQAQEIGQRQFSCLLRALGMGEAPDDSDELHFITFTADIGMGKDSKEKNADGSPKYPARNEIKRYWYPDEGNVPAPAVKAAANDNRRSGSAVNDNKPAAASAPAPAARRAGAKPWQK